MKAEDFRKGLSLELISNRQEGSFIYKKFEVSYGDRKDIVYFSYDDWGTRIEPYSGKFSDREFDIIIEHILYEGI